MTLSEEFTLCIHARDTLWTLDHQLERAENPSKRLVDKADEAQKRSDQLNKAFRARLEEIDARAASQNGVTV